VATGVGGELVIAYRNGSVLYMRTNTQGRIGSFFIDSIDSIGTVFVKVKGFFEVKTNLVKAGARGTAFEVVAQPGGAAKVTVVDGVVDVASTTGLWAAVALGAGTRGFAHPQAPLPAAASQDELLAIDRWVRRLERLPAHAGAGTTSATVAGAVVLGGLIALLASRHDGAPAGNPTHGSAPSLAAPARLVPGQTAEAAPQRQENCHNLQLVWSAVVGARDYVIDLDRFGANGWQDDLIRSAPSAAGTRVQLPGGRYRWTVHARSANTVGPNSAPHYFNCY
jgi:hypothetical protein